MFYAIIINGEFLFSFFSFFGDQKKNTEVFQVFVYKPTVL